MYCFMIRERLVGQLLIIKIGCKQAVLPFKKLLFAVLTSKENSTFTAVLV